MYQKIKDTPGLVKDSRSNAILNVDIEALKEYKLKKKSNNNILQCQNDINTLKNEISEIKDMFGTILNKLNSKDAM